MLRTRTVLILFLVLFYCGYFSNGQLMGMLSVSSFLDLPKTIEYSYNYSSPVSGTCKEQLQYLENGIVNNESWALDMKDASSTSLPAGMRRGNYYDLGQFDECYNIEHPVQDNLTIHGKYCFGVVGLGTTLIPENLVSQVVEVGGAMGVPHVAICLPSGCDADDINVMYRMNSVAVGERFCYSKDELPPLTKGAKATLALLGCLAGLMAICTMYEIYLICFKKDAVHGALLSFSIVSNYKTLTKVTFSRTNIGCLSGIRFLSTIWVLIGHEFLTSHEKPINNQSYILKFREDLANVYIYGATVAVDTFFCLGGLLVVYVILKGYDSGKKFNFMLGLTHRYLRLTPLLAVCMLVLANLSDYAGTGPIWGRYYDVTVRTCEKNWWKNLLYLQNFLSDVDNRICMGHTWYLGPDMHYFIVGFLLTYPLYRWPKRTLYFMSFLLVVGFVEPFSVTMYYKILMGLNHDYYKLYYMATAARFGPYVIGMLTGYALYLIQKNKFQLRVSTKWVVVFWTTVIGTMYLCLYYDYQLFEHDSQLLHSLYMGCVRNIWTMAVCAMILACYTGYGGFVNTFLSNSVFQVASKLTYALYLIHFPVQAISTYSTKYVYQESVLNDVFMFFGTTAISIFYSLIAWFAIEAPFVILESYMFGSGPGKKKKKETENPAVETTDGKCAGQLESNGSMNEKKSSYVPYNVNV